MSRWAGTGRLIVGILDFFGPKWRHSNNDIRRSAVSRLSDEALLAKIAKTDRAPGVRIAAVRELRGSAQGALLSEIARTDCDEDVREAAVDRLDDQDVLAEIAGTNSNKRVRWLAVKKLSNQTLLAEIAKTDNDENIRKAAFEGLIDGALLAEIFKTAGDGNVRRLAVTRLAEQASLVHIRTIYATNVDKDRRNTAAKLDNEYQILLANIAKTDSDASMRRIAAEALTDQVVLAEIAKMDSDSYVRRVVVERIDDHAILAEIAKTDCENSPVYAVSMKDIRGKLPELRDLSVGRAVRSGA